MSRTLDQILSEPDDEDDIPQDAGRLQHLLSGLNDVEDDTDVHNFIKDLEVKDAGRIKLLETKTPDVETANFDIQPAIASNFYVHQSGTDGVDITDYFENALEGKNRDVHFTETPDPGAHYGDLEWAADESECSESQPSSNGHDATTPASPPEKSPFEQYDYHEMLEHISEIDELLHNTGAITSSDKGDSRAVMEKRLEYVSALGCANPIESSCTIYMGRRRVSIGDHDRAFSYVLRPDIKAENVLGLLEQIMMSCGGTVLKPLPEDLHRSVSFRPAFSASSEWDSISAYMGANSRKQRVLVLVYIPSKMTSGASSLYHALASGRQLAANLSARSFDSFVLEVHESLCRALASEGWTLSTLFSVHGRAPLLIPLDSLIDPYFVRDLHDSFLRELDVNVSTISFSLLDYITQLEKQCAKLMTLLRPIYDRCKIALPVPPAKHPVLSQFGLPVQSMPDNSDHDNGSSSKAVESSLELSRLIILRARRTYFKSSKARAAGHVATDFRAPIDGSNPTQLSQYRAEIEGVLGDIFVQLRDMCEEIAETTCQRRTRLVADRVDQIEAFRLALIQHISKRRIETPEDRVVFTQFQSKFRIVTEDEPYILDFKATLLCSTTDTGAAVTTKGTIGNNNRSGITYITDCNIFFTSHEIFLLPMMQKVIPLGVIREVSVLKATMVASDAVCVVDDGGESSVFYVSHPAPNYADRICDMLNVLILLKKNRDAHGVGIAAQTTDENHLDAEKGVLYVENDSSPGVGDGGNHVVDASPDISNSDDTMRRVRTMAIAAVKSVNDVSAEYMGSLNSGILETRMEPTDSENIEFQTPISTATPYENVVKPSEGSTSVDFPPGKSPLARGIQAYLEKLQKNP